MKAPDVLLKKIVPAEMSVRLARAGIIRASDFQRYTLQRFVAHVGLGRKEWEMIPFLLRAYKVGVRDGAKAQLKEKMAA